MVEIRVNPTLKFTPPLNSIEELAKSAFQRLIMNPKEDNFGVHFTDNSEIQALNSKYRGFDKPTDVLSFEADIYDPEDEINYLGDIIISIETMQAQAEAADHPLETEMLLLITHGLLHLVGFDHATPEDKEEMWSLQAEILALIDVVPKQIPED